ncbi:MAG: T9SS type A sorting domain-containing protein, partial [Flavobacteriales bacterium]|nr:T9SS type A sorting domain-containing protein [Flavobacteriales bacterium]
FTICQLLDLQVDSSGIYFLGSGVVPMVTDTSQVFVGKLNVNGSLDYSFGDSGFYSPSLLGSFNQAGSIIIDSEDMLVFNGASTDSVTALEYPFIARLDKNGIPDPAFGSTGVVIWDYVNDSIVPSSMIQANYDRHGEGAYFTQLAEVNGNYFCSGQIQTSFSLRSLVLMIKKDASLNFNFNGTGSMIYEPELGYNFFSNSIHYEDGQIQIALENNGFINEDRFVIQKMDTLGNLGSLLTYSFSGLAGSTKMYRKIDGGYYLGGYMKDVALTTPGFDSDRFFMTRLSPGGVVQPAFGVGGEFMADLATGDEIGLEDFTGSGNQIVMAGYINNVVAGNYVDFVFMSMHHRMDVGVNESKKQKLSIYPNPTSSWIQIECKGINRVLVYSADGQLLKDDSETAINLKEYASGTYFIKVITDQNTFVEQVIKY